MGASSRTTVASGMGPTISSRPSGSVATRLTASSEINAYRTIDSMDTESSTASNCFSSFSTSTIPDSITSPNSSSSDSEDWSIIDCLLCFSGNETRITGRLKMGRRAAVDSELSSWLILFFSMSRTSSASSMPSPSLLTETVSSLRLSRPVHKPADRGLSVLDSSPDPISCGSRG